MNSELQQFIDGDRLAIKAEVIISQEILKNGYRLTYIRIDGHDTYMYEFWTDGRFGAKTERKKNTGGKPSYAKVYIDKLRKLKNKGVSYDLIGSMVWLADNIQWNTGLLIKGRGKNRKPLDINDLMSIFNIKKSKMYVMIDELKKNSLLLQDDEGFRVSSDFMQKGGK